MSYHLTDLQNEGVRNIYVFFGNGSKREFIPKVVPNTTEIRQNPIIFKSVHLFTHKYVIYVHIFGT